MRDATGTSGRSATGCPRASLRQLAGEAVRARSDGGNEAADEVIASLSLHQPGALTAHLPALWDIRPNRGSAFPQGVLDE
jgi:hypothetical protein